jgi:hypothetical protein
LATALLDPGPAGQPDRGPPTSIPTRRCRQFWLDAVTPVAAVIFAD